MMMGEAPMGPLPRLMRRPDWGKRVPVADPDLTAVRNCRRKTTSLAFG